MTALLHIPKCDDIDIARLLLSNGAFVNAKSPDGLTSSLAFAVFNESKEMISLVLSHDVDVNSADLLRPYCTSFCCEEKQH